MKRGNVFSILVFAFLFLFGFNAALWCQEAKRVLFIGNSYVYTNNLPQVLSRVAEHNGKRIVCESSTMGGYTFWSHLASPATLAKIQSGNYDCIVLQGQSQEVAFPDEQFYFQVYPNAMKLDSVCKVYNPQARIIFFGTWGYRYGDAMNCPYYEAFCTFESMTERLTENYRLMARDFRSDMSPVGEAFLQSFLTDSTVVLHSSDNSHPAMNGTYIAACCFYCSIFGEALASVPAINGISADEAEYFMRIANRTVVERRNEWNFSELSSDISEAGESCLPDFKAYLRSENLLRLESKGISGETQVDLISADGRIIASLRRFIPLGGAIDISLPQYRGLMFIKLTNGSHTVCKPLPVTNF